MTVEERIRHYVAHTVGSPAAPESQFGHTPKRTLVAVGAVALVAVTVFGLTRLGSSGTETSSIPPLEVSTRPTTISTADDPEESSATIEQPRATASSVASVVGTSTTAQPLPSEPDTTSFGHEMFADYVAEAERVFGEVEIGASCEDWPDRDKGELSDLRVVPASNADGGPCVVIGWAYSGEIPNDLPADAFVAEGTLRRAPIFNASGEVIAHFDSAEVQSGTAE